MDKAETVKKGFWDQEVNALPLKIFLPVAGIIWLIAFTGRLPKDAFSTLIFLLSIGVFLQFAGNKTPILGKYIGFGGILPLFGASLLVTVGAINSDLKEQCGTFVSSHISPYLVSILICGAIIGKMDRNTLKKAASRYIPVILIGQCAAIAGSYFIGKLLHYDTFHSLVLVAFACFSGGSGGASIRMPAILSDLGLDGAGYVGFMMTAASLANIEAILFSSLLNSFGKIFPAMTGNGALIRSKARTIEVQERKSAKFDGDFKKMFRVFLIIGMIVIVSNTLSVLIKPIINLNYLVYVVVISIAIKITGVLPQEWEDSINYWQTFATPIFLPAMIAGMGIGSIDLVETFSSLSPSFFILVTTTVFCFVAGSMIGGFVFGMYPVEAGISVGCCSTNIGGTGDIICCETANRLNLYPFAAISTRIGGAIALLELSMLLPYIQLPL